MVKLLLFRFRVTNSKLKIEKITLTNSMAKLSFLHVFQIKFDSNIQGFYSEAVMNRIKKGTEELVNL